METFGKQIKEAFVAIVISPLRGVWQLVVAIVSGIAGILTLPARGKRENSSATELNTELVHSLIRTGNMLNLTMDRLCQNCVDLRSAIQGALEEIAGAPMDQEEELDQPEMSANDAWGRSPAHGADNTKLRQELVQKAETNVLPEAMRDMANIQASPIGSGLPIVGKPENATSEDHTPEAAEPETAEAAETDEAETEEEVPAIRAE